MKSRSKRQPRAHGQLRQSQVVGMYGPGAMVDLPAHSIIVAGLESWGDPVRDAFRPIVEERLSERVGHALARSDVRLYAPPIDLTREKTSPSGITAWIFPEWFVAQVDDEVGDGVRRRPLVHRIGLTNGKWIGPSKKKVPVVPIRFVQACPRGHISDLDWHGFVHEYEGACKRRLSMEERGTSGDLADLLVRCECGKVRSMAQALKRDPPALGFCRGQRPWIGPRAREDCGGESGKALPNRLLVRSASDAYFSQQISVIAIPASDATLREAVDRVFEDFLQYVESIEDLARERKKAKVAAALGTLSDQAVWAEIARRKSGSRAEQKKIKHAELETLLGVTTTSSDDVPDADFHATAVPLPPLEKRSSLMQKLERIVLVHRLREVVAQVGFTRFEPVTTDIDGELDIEIKTAALSRETSWVPAIENRGEGIFIAFRKDVVDAWASRDAVARRADQLSKGFEVWKAREPGRRRQQWPGPRYVALHSLSHFLISAVSLACGYSAASIRERIYVTSAGYGILLYTGTPDSEGTLGGLVQIGNDLERHLRAALDLARLCSNDPVCAQHRPHDAHEERFLHGAACHGCLLLAEPSCEKRNDHLDRALVVATVEDHGAELFDDDDLEEPGA